MKTKKSILALLLTGLLIQPLAASANSTNLNLPEIGTAAVSTLSIGQEIEMGDYYLRMLRGSAPLTYDPLISEYVNKLGGKLVASADSVQTPFNFFVMRSNVLNAFAFFGGNVVIHSRLILDTDNESQLASVMAHEISHVTQRHLARAMEAQKNNSPYVWGAALGSVLLALASPEAGMAAMSTTIAGSQQSMISFTQSNEQEADRAGMRILTRAGFDPQASPEFLQKLADQARFMSKPPEILLTHPLPDSRLSDVRNRANQFAQKSVASSLDYYLVKARIAAFSNDKSAIDRILDEYKKTNNAQIAKAIIYGEALSLYTKQQYQSARSKLEPLYNQDSTNIWYVDLMTDLDLELNQKTQAIERLQAAIKANPSSQVLQLNLANAYIQNKDYQRASSLLHRYTHANNSDINGWELLATVYSAQRLRAEEMSARAEVLALQGQFAQAINLLTNAKSYTKDNQILLARLDARAAQLQQLQQRYATYQR
ncbi:beta-barrel assembly-enhancing protease [Zophobihabitans entericus]|uniref:Putative beta-barrel assembly-enhancing protease n=1 Tax=Zophobihabitans entericus TaxID=1635327 RepID=A0A6G9IE46_9GAMM|nr:M48 family metalloprotease [Zophobihabitans entericus]QIQ21860.1 M48 family metallopeptidase [Zophobihabitans entericus]